MNDDDLLGEEIGDSEGEEIPEGQEEMEEIGLEDEEGEMIEEMEEDEEQFPDSNLEDGNEFPEVSRPTHQPACFEWRPMKSYCCSVITTNYLLSTMPIRHPRKNSTTHIKFFRGFIVFDIMIRGAPRNVGPPESR